MTPLDHVWESVKHTLFLTREQFDQSLAGYTIEPFFNDAEELFGVVIHKGPSFHFMTFGPTWKLTKEILRQWPGNLIKQYGYAETFTPIDDARQQRFNRRVGFIETRRDEQYIHYRIERLPCL